ncbi:hypothetical protein V6Z12_A06G149300 [Gossypium hirsutum]
MACKQALASAMAESAIFSQGKSGYLYAVSFNKSDNFIHLFTNSFMVNFVTVVPNNPIDNSSNFAFFNTQIIDLYC